MTVARPSPNHDARPAGGAIDMLLLHYTGMTSAEAALSRLCDAAAKVSAHYLIDEGGGVYALVAEERRAWHAGVACWAGEEDINACSIGIELVNPGHEFGYRAFPQAQMDAVTELCLDILRRHPIPGHRVLGHADVAPGRKEDPGELFDWAALAAAAEPTLGERRHALRPERRRAQNPCRANQPYGGHAAWRSCRQIPRQQRDDHFAQPTQPD